MNVIAEHLRPWLAVLASVPMVFGCGSDDTRLGNWRGTVDTMPSGQVLVTNTDDGMWTPSEAWQVVEELRIGTQQEDAPELFGRVGSLEVDAEGRIWVLDDQANEIRVFDREGRHVRTIGHEGGGPGEFRAPQAIHRSPDGTMWVPDPQNSRVSIFDTSGTYLEGRFMTGGFGASQWPGGFDRSGYYHLPIRVVGEDGREIAIVRLTAAHAVVDTVQVPIDPQDRDVFELRRSGMRAVMNVPFDGRFRWRLAPSGNLWGMLTDEYRLQEFTPAGDTLRTVTKEYQPLPVTPAEMEETRVELEAFIQAGGDVDWSKIPRTKPATVDLFFDDEGNFWVVPETAPGDASRLVEVFARDGLFLGVLRLPFAIELAPLPLIRNSTLYAVVKDDLGVSYVVRARIVKP